jgi:hypothetical protein
VGKRHFEKNFENPLKTKPEIGSLLQDNYRITTGQVQDLASRDEPVQEQFWKTPQQTLESLDTFCPVAGSGRDLIRKARKQYGKSES